MKHSELTNQPKRDHSVVVKDFFGEGQNLDPTSTMAGRQVADLQA